MRPQCSDADEILGPSQNVRYALLPLFILVLEFVSLLTRPLFM